MPRLRKIPLSLNVCSLGNNNAHKAPVPVPLPKHPTLTAAQTTYTPYLLTVEEAGDCWHQQI
ncbi:hypothetical protein B0H12DRAFT_1147935 [Mycena haematopus]|nr:hypothetical protein B0H12DRAFT_1147935 [Mycena haematopus]